MPYYGIEDERRINNDADHFDRKCVIIAAYANNNPQVAAEWSANLTSWGEYAAEFGFLVFWTDLKAGSGNTFTNELFFIGTRPNPSNQPICTNLPQNPYGDFKIKVSSSGKYVAAASGGGNLATSAGSADGAGVFSSAYLPNSGTLQLTSTSRYVTADQSGNYALSASRAAASSWERFVIRQKKGAAKGVYTIKAASNGLYVTVGGDGSLMNNEASEQAASGFEFVSV